MAAIAGITGINRYIVECKNTEGGENTDQDEELIDT